MIRKYILHELKYLVYSKTFIIITVILCACYSVMLFMNYNSVTDSYASYVHCKEYYEENNIQEEGESYDMEVNEDGSVTVSNPIVYYEKIVGQYMFASSPKYTLTQMMEVAIIIFPLLFGVLGLIASTYDYKYKTIKNKLIRLTKNEYLISKNISLVIISLASIVISLIYAKIAGHIMFNMLKQAFPYKEFDYTSFMVGNIGLKFITVMLMAICYLEIGFLLGIAFKNTLIGTVIVAVYSLLCRDMFKYDLNNAFTQLFRNIFENYGVVTISPNNEITTFLAITIILLTMVGSFILSAIIINKRSAFVS